MGTRRGCPHGYSGLVESAAPTLPSAQSFPPAPLVSITPCTNANQCIRKTWQRKLILLMKALLALQFPAEPEMWLKTPSTALNVMN